MKVVFTKMQGAGNDYIYINCMQGLPQNPSLLSQLMSPRHSSVGADGLVLICKSLVADAKMRMFNADGGEGAMCGNAIRCVGKYLYDNGITDKTELTIETLSGIKTLWLTVENGKVTKVKVDMGYASFLPESINLCSKKPLINAPYTVEGKEYRITCVSVGNPHCVIPVDNVADYDVKGVGSLFEKNSMFIKGVNTEFVQYVNATNLIMRVWERGSGETFACGTGASAVVAAYAYAGLCEYDTPVTVKLLGGELYITVRHDLKVYMCGGAVKVYEGVYEYED